MYGILVFNLGRYHHLSETIDPSSPNRECSERNERVLRAFAERYFPDGSGPTMALKACIFSNTPDATNTRDEHFILDLHPQYPQVCIASPCSGHGFKFSSVVGEIMADLVEHGETAHDISLHRVARFVPSA
jgi:sarcosine oxidase